MKTKPLTLLLFFCSISIWAQQPWQNPALSAEERAADLLSQLTLDEKATLMMDVSKPIERLGIRGYNWWNEALHGVARNGMATVFPQAIGMAASFNDNAVLQVFEAASDEARAKYNEARRSGNIKRYQGLTFWTPNVNIFRDPRWGRGQETYGEDPYLSSRMGLAAVRGLQGYYSSTRQSSTHYDKLHACAKHFAVHSGPERSRHRFNAENIAPRDLLETYLPAFKTLVQEGDVREVMCAYNRYEGDPCCGSNRLLMQILRQEWGYKGMVVSDCGAIGDFYVKGHHETYPTAEAASAAAVMTGTDVECGSVYKNLPDAVRHGLVSEAHVDTCVMRLLTARFRLGEMDSKDLTPWAALPMDVVGCAAHRQLALNMARESMVLLKNNGILPLNSKNAKLMVMGPNAADSVMMWGNYNGTPAYTVTILDAIRQKAGDIRYLRGCNTIEDSTVNHKNILSETAGYDTIVFVGGISAKYEGEEMKVDYPGFKRGDRTSIELPQVQRDLIKTLHDAGKHIILVNCSGSAMGLVPETEACDAILQAWYPGEQGGTAVADVLFGDYNPAGRLPVTFYRNVEQLPDFEDYSMQGRTYRYFNGEPLFPFGYGLSYTSFEYRKIKKHTTAAGGTTLAVNVANTGMRDGDEVVQVYIKRLADTDGPQKSLRAFRRIHLKAGQKQTVKIDLPPSAFETFDTATNTMRVLPGDYLIMVGGDSRSATNNTIRITLTL